MRVNLRVDGMLIAAATAVAVVSAPASAAPTLFTTQTSFTAATAGTSFTTQGFETPFAASNTLQFPGLTISCTNCAAGRSSSYPTTGGFSLGINGGNPLSFSFDSAVTAFAFSIRDFGTLASTSLSLQVNGSSIPLVSNFNGASGNTLFFGVTDMATFRNAVLTGGISGDNYFIDDVRFGAAATTPPVTTAVPETATWGMMILGFGLAGAGTRRRVRRSDVKFAGALA